MDSVCLYMFVLFNLHAIPICAHLICMCALFLCVFFIVESILSIKLCQPIQWRKNQSFLFSFSSHFSSIPQKQRIVIEKRQIQTHKRAHQNIRLIDNLEQFADWFGFRRVFAFSTAL